MSNSAARPRKARASVTRFPAKKAPSRCFPPGLSSSASRPNDDGGLEFDVADWSGRTSTALVHRDGAEIVVNGQPAADCYEQSTASWVVSQANRLSDDVVRSLSDYLEPVGLSDLLRRKGRTTIAVLGGEVDCTMHRYALVAMPRANPELEFIVSKNLSDDRLFVSIYRDAQAGSRQFRNLGGRCPCAPELRPHRHRGDGRLDGATRRIRRSRISPPARPGMRSSQSRFPVAAGKSTSCPIAGLPCSTTAFVPRHQTHSWWKPLRPKIAHRRLTVRPTRCRKGQASRLPSCTLPSTLDRSVREQSRGPGKRRDTGPRRRDLPVAADRPGGSRRNHLALQRKHRARGFPGPRRRTGAASGAGSRPRCDSQAVHRQFPMRRAGCFTQWGPCGCARPSW
jgi:hypothetical protein